MTTAIQESSEARLVSNVAIESNSSSTFDVETLQADDNMAAVMIAGILTLAFVTLVTLMIIVGVWTAMSAGS